jgi:hypothetical protein
VRSRGISQHTTVSFVGVCRRAGETRTPLHRAGVSTAQAKKIQKFVCSPSFFIPLPLIKFILFERYKR